MNLKKAGYLTLALLAVTHLVQTNPERPNVVFFLVDDFGWGALSSSGSKFHETPNIDKLAASGMSFTNGYAACTVCSPSRPPFLPAVIPGEPTSPTGLMVISDPSPNSGFPIGT